MDSTKHVLLIAATTFLSANASVCWINTYGRGVGKVRTVNKCPPSYSYDGVSTCDCHVGKICNPHIWTGNHCCGAVCTGLTFTPSSNPSCPYHFTCPSDAPQLGAPGSPDLCYPRCASGYKQEGCCLCQAGACPIGMKQQGALCCSSEKECTAKNIELAKDALSLFKSALGAEDDPVALVQAATKASCDFAMPICQGPGSLPPPPLPDKKEVCKFLENGLEVVGSILKYKKDFDSSASIAESVDPDPTHQQGINLDIVGSVVAGATLLIGIAGTVIIVHRCRSLKRSKLEEVDISDKMAQDV